MYDTGLYNAAFTRLLIEELRRQGVTSFCIAPGSRSAPLTLAAAENSGVTTTVHFDERGLAFHAIGYARATGKPAAVITTSGTAVANLLPAVVEASIDELPLLLLTADRPPELRQTSANQTIDQVNFLSSQLRWQTDLPCPDPAIKPEMLLTTVAQAVARSRDPIAGPVQLNCMFREPLLPSVPSFGNGEEVDNLVKASLRTDAPYTRKEMPLLAASNMTIERITEKIDHSKNGIVIVGALRSDTERQAAEKIAIFLGWPTFADITSGLRFSKMAKIITHYDLITESKKFTDTHAPDTILHLGGRLTSKRLQQAIERTPPPDYIQVNPYAFRLDPGHLVSEHIRSELPPFCDSLLAAKLALPASKATTPWQEADRLASEEISKRLNDEADLSEPVVANLLSRLLPDNGALFLASSMPIRAMEMYATSRKGIYRVASNRGASGIDGTIASAVGYARGSGRVVTCLIGDLALLHDLNSLSLLQNSGLPVVLVILNNNGGGIFSMLPVSEIGQNFEKYFITPHDCTFENAASLFSLKYENVSTVKQFTNAYESAISGSEPALIEVTLDRQRDYLLHASIAKEIAGAADLL